MLTVSKRQSLTSEKNNCKKSFLWISTSSKLENTYFEVRQKAFAIENGIEFSPKFA